MGGGGTLPLMTPPHSHYPPPQKNKLWLSCFVILLVTTDGCRYVCRHVCRRTSQNYLILILPTSSADASADESAANFLKIWCFSNFFSHFFELFRKFWVQLSPSLFFNTGQFSDLLQV